MIFKKNAKTFSNSFIGQIQPKKNDQTFFGFYLFPTNVKELKRQKLNYLNYLILMDLVFFMPYKCNGDQNVKIFKHLLTYTNAQFFPLNICGAIHASRLLLFMLICHILSASRMSFQHSTNGIHCNIVIIVVPSYENI